MTKWQFVAERGAASELGASCFGAVPGTPVRFVHNYSIFAFALFALCIGDRGIRLLVS